MVSSVILRAGLTMVPNVPWHRAPRREGPPARPTKKIKVRAIDASGNAEYLSVVSRSQKRSKRYDDCRESGEDEVRLTGRDKFRVETFLVVIDQLQSSLRKRIDAYTATCEMYLRLFQISTS